MNSSSLDTAETPRRASSAGSEGGTDSQTLTLQMRARPRFVSDSAAQAQVVSHLLTKSCLLVDL
eukprot:3958857-Amphidinium_carterae.1